MKIAIPITAQTMDEALRDIDHASEFADIIELRIDYLQNPELDRLIRNCSKPVIVTNRTKLEGGKFTGSEEQRIASLQEAIDLGAAYIDIEADYFQPLNKKSTTIIVSHHNFEQTPDLDTLTQKFSDKNADIVKIATKARTYEDSLRMLQFISKYKQSGQEIIGICMGQEGIITRILGPLYGSYLTFASLDQGKASAPGQLTVRELRAAWNLLKVN